MSDVASMTLLPSTRVGTGEPAFVFLHCFGTSRQEWRDVADRLAGEFASIAIDLPGFGDAADAPGHDVGSMAGAVALAIAVERLERFVLVGHSLSGKVACALAARGVEGLVGLALVAPSPPEPEPMRDEDRARMLGYAMDERCAADFFDRNTAAPLAGERRERAIAEFCRINPDAWRAWLTDGANEDWSDRVGTIPLPTLLITGADDGLLNLAGQRRTTLRHLVAPRIVELPACGHLPTLECPDLLADHLTVFARALRDSH